jgi:hypothetical protein
MDEAVGRKRRSAANYSKRYSLDSSDEDVRSAVVGQQVENFRHPTEEVTYNVPLA